MQAQGRNRCQGGCSATGSRHRGQDTQSKTVEYKQCTDTRPVYSRIGGKSTRLARSGMTPVPTPRVRPYPLGPGPCSLACPGPDSGVRFENAGRNPPTRCAPRKCQTPWRDLVNPPVQPYCTNFTNGSACACVGLLSRGGAMSPPFWQFLWIALPCLLLLGAGATSAQPALIHLKSGSIRAHAHDNLCVCCSDMCWAMLGRRTPCRPAPPRRQCPGLGSHAGACPACAQAL